MKPEDHQAAAQRIERSMRKCGLDEHEILIEAAMLAGSHWLNAHLHRLGATQPAQDVVHTYLLVVNELRRLSVADAQAVAALGAIEDLRPAYVRGAPSRCSNRYVPARAPRDAGNLQPLEKYMKAVRVIAHPDGGRIEVQEIARATVGPGQVLVRARASGLNRGEITQARDRRAGDPMTVGVEFAGEVAEVGSEVTA